MRQLTLEQQAALRHAVEHAGEIKELPGRLAVVYQDFQREVDARKPRCDQSGRCCRFDEYGHLLFVTTAELAVFRSQRPAGAERDAQESSPQHRGRLSLLTAGEFDPERNPGGACRYQSNHLCTVHAIRPFGCRIFFCDSTATGWQEQQYGRFHTRIKQLHDELDVPYFYVEWRQGLMALWGERAG